MRRFLLASASALLLTVGLGAASAQEGTPGASPAAGLVPEDPARCRVEPRPVEYFAQFLGTPAPGAATPTPFVLPPEAEPAGPDVVAAVTAFERELIACFNGGDHRRALALYTEGYLRRLQAGVTLAELEQFLPATPVPADPGEQEAVAAVRDVVLLPDGRVGALVEYAVPADPALDHSHYEVYAVEGGRYRLDDSLEPEAVVPEGTPAP